MVGIQPADGYPRRRRSRNHHKGPAGGRDLPSQAWTTRIPRSPTGSSRYWHEFAGLYLWACAAIGVIVLSAWLNTYYDLGFGDFILIVAVTGSVGWLVYDAIRTRRRRGRTVAEKPIHTAKPAIEREGRTDHLVTIAAKGRGKDRLVVAECHECEWRQQHSGRGNWPDRRVAKLASAHTTRIVA